MSIWFFLWLGLSGALLYFVGWTHYILYRQKQAWKEFAAKKKLRYNPKKMFVSPEINGVLQGYTVSLFTGEHQAPDARGLRKLTAIEVHLSSRMPFSGAVAGGGMVEIVRRLNLKEETLPVHPDWNKTWIAASDNRPALDIYLTPERLGVLTALMKIKNAWVILIFRNDIMLLRLDTPHPLESMDKLDKLTKKLIDSAKKLEVQPGEETRMKTAVARKPQREASLPLPADEKNVGLTLEEELAPQAPEPPAPENSEED